MLDQFILLPTCNVSLDIKLCLCHTYGIMTLTSQIQSNESPKEVERKNRKLTKEEEENRQLQIKNNKLLKEHNNR